jgi:hypothetical protein
MFQRDYNYGIQHQNELLPRIQSFFGGEVKATAGKFDPYDYESNTASFELKSRTNKKDTYPTTCLPADKVKTDHGKKQIYLFNFTDGLYYIPYDKEMFSTFECKPFRRFRVGVKDKEKDYLYIPVDKLIPVQ